VRIKSIHMTLLFVHIYILCTIHSTFYTVLLPTNVANTIGSSPGQI